MKVTAVTVTYGKRFCFLREVVDALIIEKVDYIVIVLNGVDNNELKDVLSLKDKNPCIHFLNLNENTGSAKGFGEGIRFAKNLDAEFIWLLDDDNLPLSNSLIKLKEEWGFCKKNNDNFALLSYRADRYLFKKAIESDSPLLMIGRPNSFLGFDYKKLLRIKDKLTYNKSITKGKVSVAPYGGFFFNKSILNTVGFPNEKFFLYGDDYDFSYRFTENDFPIYLIMESEIKDLETSFHLQKKKFILKTRFSQTNSKVRLYYNLRNNIIFEQKFVNNKFIYRINKIQYIIILFFILLISLDFWKFTILIKAIKDANVFLNDNNE